MKSLILILYLSFPIFSFAQDDLQRRQKHFNIEDNLAIDGYDPVSYFNGKPEEGKKQYQYIYQGITYYFQSKATLEIFKSNPSKYEPAYGGWCAFAMGENGAKVPVDPETYKIINGKLYLFYNFYFNNTLKKWNERETELMHNADKFWTSIFSK